MEMAIGKNDSIHFEITFEDGSTALLSVDQTTLRSGDHVVHLIAGERKKAGLLPDKPTKSIRRLN